MILQKPLIAAAYLCHPPTRPPLNLTQQGAPEGITVFTYEASHSQSFLSLLCQAWVWNWLVTVI